MVRLIVAYARQETLDPVLRQLKALATGIAGAVLLALGTVLLAVGFVRALQAEFGSTGRSTVIVPVPAPIAGKGGGFSSADVGRFSYGTGAHLSGDWSWVPYMGGALFALLIAGFCVTRILKGTGR